MLVIGIDPGTASTGYGLVRQDQGELKVVDYGVIATSADDPMPSRLSQLYSELQKILALHQPDLAAVEQLFFQTNVKTAISVGQARGVALLALAQIGLEVGEYTPNDIKQAVVGYGGADKHQVQEMVRMMLAMEEIPKPDDAADALAVAICHIHTYQYHQRLRSAE
ncbi:MAG: crossover junction endodeoxyribonuclease RuvC [Anaerolineales bacterium]|jgi:crossover junction endodeoxyribonuclease RuvC